MTNRKRRSRHGIEMTLSVPCLARLKLLSEELQESRSEIAERAIMDWKIPNEEKAAR